MRQVIKTLLRSIVPIISIVIPILTTFTLIETTNNSQFSKDIYALKVDFRNVSFYNFVQPQRDFWQWSRNLTLEDSGLSEIYTFGLRGYCKGYIDQFTDDYTTTYCSGINTTYDQMNPESIWYQDIYDIGDQNPLNQNQTWFLKFPLHVPNFTGAYYKRSLKISYYGILVGDILSAIASVIYIIRFINPFYLQGPLIQAIGSLVSIFSLIAFLAGGGVATKLFADTKLGFKRGSGIYRILGTWGSTKFWLFLWFAISLQVVMLFWIIIMGCLVDDTEEYLIRVDDAQKKRARKKRKATDPFDLEKQEFSFPKEKKKSDSKGKKNSKSSYK
ncbi:putative membrane protein [Wickerhamomyces ciferrii]|uniref:Membrane protein n=1 Tax=Wickerhamomyces ciferrii (strain ATCC 14091 / BCRC 22168 / CBS 111 / JCM 3599 / NBRC 0793 / NRRL Y-1031 F-60-10) TaxID=1206466 RepID=K0KKQ3_WICCF|nr:uncharacterized protein BN7_5346 [Wickerhamomyces ciferrii]CCH45760.1 putative membrane protein [Wickerhamomyces ciferrii]